MNTKSTKGTVHNLNRLLQLHQLSKMENMISQLLHAMAQTTRVWHHNMPQEEAFCGENYVIKR